MTENKGDLISREALLKRVDEERKYLIARGQTGAEHILVHNFRDLIDNAPTVELNDKSLEIAKKSIELGRKIGKLEGKLERPQGEWVEAEITEEYRQYGFDLRVVCSRCGSEQSYFDFNEYHEPVAVTFIRSRFCSFCGARMIKDFTGEAIP